MVLNLLKVADVFDAAAAHIDVLETEKRSSVHAEKKAKVDELASKFAAATGDEISDEMRAKLAAADGDVVALFKQLAEKNAGTVESLGAASDREDGTREVTSVKEASAAADERFLTWVTG